jgi:trehalose synthase
LRRLIPLLNELGVNSRWDVIKGGEEFFYVTKCIHNALHGKKTIFTKRMKEIFLEETMHNIRQMDLKGEIIFVHDPQPVGLIIARSFKGQRWVWRCHIDLSNPQEDCLEFIRSFVEQYDATVFSAPAFAQRLPVRQFLIPPSIDPLSEKNKELSPEFISQVLEDYDIDPKVSIILQVSRFDYLKDPFGVINAFKKVRKTHKCQLVLAGGGAMDDPEGGRVLKEIREQTENEPDIHIICLPPTANVEINALQRASTIVVQKSLREGFGLTVTEALWKAKPVVAMAVGGLVSQIKHRVNGLLVHSVEGAIQAIKFLLNNPKSAQRLGKNGKEFVRQNFLITRHIKDYLLMFIAIERQISGLAYL